MCELSLSEKRKILRREFRPFNQENGFRFIRPNTLLRERNDILQFLQFQIKPGYLSCDIASQPLYIPSAILNLGISIRIQFLGNRTRWGWGGSDRTEEAFAADVQDMLQLVAAGGLQWFEEMGEPENLIKNTLDENFRLTQGYAPVLRLRTVALSHLYLGHIPQGILYLEALIEEYRRHPKSEAAAYRIPECQAWIDMAKNRPEELPDRFRSIIAQTRGDLRIGRLPTCSPSPRQSKKA